ncbi:MAG: hypothetical protein QNJ32_09910 [Xenococcaceae cyanobacterium MO_167.B27]|nr:hypothetical protein [Xenococcaceae cyanobacterium MO_167.B27]
MKFLLLKALLLRRAKDEGFTLPIVIAIGLVMLLLSTVNLIQSGEETVLSISKQGSSNALASAEFGIARYRELLNNNRVLAVYNLDQWTNVAGEACNNITNSAGGWADNNSNTTWRDVSLNETTFSVDFNDDGDQTDTNVVIGEYKIVDYEYDNDGLVDGADTNGTDNRNISLISDVANDIDGDGESDARGFLTVKGRAPDGSEAQIEVEIPLGVNTDDLNSLDPALWIRQSSVTESEFGNITLTSGNIVLYRASASPTGCDDFTEGVITGIRDPRQLPPIVDIASVTARELDGDISAETGSTVNYFNGSEILLGTDYDNDGDYDDDGTNDGPQARNTVDGVARYYYRTNSQNLVIDSGESILADGLGKVIIYVDGDLDINTGASLIRLANFSNIATSRYLEIHVAGNVDISGDGDLEIKGLLHVPNGTVTISGLANVDVTGSIWANDWDNSSGGTVTIDTDDYKFYSLTPNRTPKPLTYRPTNWETQEVE